jgi:hypothetical protein
MTEFVIKEINDYRLERPPFMAIIEGQLGGVRAGKKGCVI